MFGPAVPMGQGIGPWSLNGHLEPAGQELQDNYPNLF